MCCCMGDGSGNTAWGRGNGGGAPNGLSKQFSLLIYAFLTLQHGHIMRRDRCAQGGSDGSAILNA